MVYKAKSQNVKKIEEQKGKSDRMEAAVAEWRQARDSGLKISFRNIAARHQVSSSTLERRCNQKGVPMTQFNAGKQRLTVTEESMLAQLNLESASQGFPLARNEIEQFANAILQTRVGADETVGKQWYFRFLDRHHDILQTHWSKPLDTQRAKSLIPVAVKSWFDIVEEFVVKLGIKPENIYGMDESGFPPANQGKTRVVGGRGTKTQHKQGGADRENVTAVVTICADGTTVKPMIIYKGKNFMQKWNNNNVADA